MSQSPDNSFPTDDGFSDPVTSKTNQWSLKMVGASEGHPEGFNIVDTEIINHKADKAKERKKLKRLRSKRNKLARNGNGDHDASRTETQTVLTDNSVQPDADRESNQKTKMKLKKKLKRALKRKLQRQKSRDELQEVIGNSQENHKENEERCLGDDAQSKESTDKPLSKLQKLLELRRKKRKAKRARARLNGKSGTTPAEAPAEAPADISSTNSSTPPTPVLSESEIQRKLRIKLKKKEKLKKKRDLAKKKELEGESSRQTSVDERSDNKNEIVLSKKNKKKMRKVANKISPIKLEETSKEQDLEQGTANPSFDESLLESSAEKAIDHNTQSKSKKKRKKRKKSLKNSSDAVDGITSSTMSSENPSLSSFQAANTVSEDIVEKSRKKKFVVGKLLQEAHILEKSTLHDLKKKRLLGDDPNPESAKEISQGPSSLRERMSDQLKSARFRWLNEQLYTSDSYQALKFFKEDPEAYDAYHSGYRNQVAQWPINPLDVIIKSISSLPKETVVADFGCGDARLAETLKHLKVYSFDLVSKKPEVISCDMANTSLLMESVDVAVFCLSLMGKNLNDFLLEANRVLKVGGLLLIAEVESRFNDIDNFTSAMQHFGFQLKRKDISNQMFIFMDFKKLRFVSKTGKLPTLELDPCVYKKR